MQLLRTPDSAFADLAGYPFAAHYLEVTDPDGGRPLRLHHLDEGDPAGRVVLLLHGEPTWSYLYRNVLPPLVADGCRVLAPDLIGFGRSDKPTSTHDHTYARHVAWLTQALFDELDLRDIVLFGQDWGGLLGLRLVAAHPDRFAGVVASNTALPTGDQAASEAFLAWQRAARELPVFATGRIVDGGSLTRLPAEVIAAYDAPFPDAEHQAGARALPGLVPTTPADPAAEDNRRAWQALQGYTAPFLTAFSDGDPITAGGQRPLQQLIPGAHDQPHRTIEGAGHFVQEDAPEQVVAAIRTVLERTTTAGS